MPPALESRAAVSVAPHAKQPRAAVIPTPHAKQPRAAVIRASLRDDLRVAGTAVLASAVLLASPMAAHAKGGGHGGGGGGHSSSHSSSHHSSSSSSRRSLHQYNSAPRSASSRRSSRRSSSSSRGSYSSSSTTIHASPPPPMLLFPDESAARRENGYFCPANLPRAGERVDIVGEAGQGLRTATVISSTPASQAALYGAGGGVSLQPVPGFETDCTVAVRYDDGTTGTVSAAEQPKSLGEQVTEAVVDVGLVGGYVWLNTLGEGGGESAWESAEERHEELLDELRDARERQRGEGAEPLAPPASGEYWGSSEESDEGDQAVRTTINFGGDGTISGRGRDGVDGSYRIVRGRWGALEGDAATQRANPTVAWIEKYDEGFEVAVKGRYDARTGKITARFTSSRGVRGDFELAPKPSIF